MNMNNDKKLKELEGKHLFELWQIAVKKGVNRFGKVEIDKNYIMFGDKETGLVWNGGVDELVKRDIIDIIEVL